MLDLRPVTAACQRCEEKLSGTSTRQWWWSVRNESKTKLQGTSRRRRQRKWSALNQLLHRSNFVLPRSISHLPPPSCPPPYSLASFTFHSAPVFQLPAHSVHQVPLWKKKGPLTMLERERIDALGKKAMTLSVALAVSIPLTRDDAGKKGSGSICLARVPRNDEVANGSAVYCMSVF
eukprot:746332-Hanusia_phi.AAC.6